MKPFDLTPDPKVLIALTQTPLKPLDALSELIDNAIDSFVLAKNMGQKIDDPIAIVSLPSGSDLKQNEGYLRVRDNGPGMSPDMAEKALKAGFSGNNPYDSLGLFGMGLNIATGKLGSRTTLITARKEDDQALKVVVDLVEIQNKRSYEVIPQLTKKPEGFEHGTFIEISGWWPEGNSNFGFIRKLVSYGRPRIRREIGRRYSTLLRKGAFRILVDGEMCELFEHCVWGDNRFVERQRHGKIPAVFRFDKNIGSQTRCTTCYALIPPDRTVCPVCDSSSLRTVREKVRGWVGIQRYDDASHYGIDLIRNGRVIRMLEKTAFFEFTDEFGNIIKDYPADSPYGRIVGEVHLDHVPVDFMKQDYQRSSPEWQRAMTYLRGNSSLQPTQPGAEENISPVFMLYQGYRRVRRCGTHDMYMGYWEAQSKGPKRIDRQTERDYLSKFHERLPGYYDDTEWWKLVENADSSPVESLIDCPDCSADNLESAEVCQVCGRILTGKQCVSCCEVIPISAITCPHCGNLQGPKTVKPWKCLVCGKTNRADAEKCIYCDAVIGTLNPLSSEYLKDNSDRDDDLSIAECSVRLADGSNSQAIDVDCFITRKSIMNTDGTRLPAVIHKGESIQIFLDKQHPVFQAFGLRPEELIAGEIAYYLHVINGRLSGSIHNTAHSLSNLQWIVLEKYWSDALTDSTENVREDVEKFFSDIRQRLANIFKDKASDLFDEFTDEDTKPLVENLIEANEDISALGKLKTTGKYLNYISAPTIVRLFKRHTAEFFDGNVWSQPYAKIYEISESVMNQVRSQTRLIYLNCLEDCSAFLVSQKPDPILVKRTRNSLQYLIRRLEY